MGRLNKDKKKEETKRITEGVKITWENKKDGAVKCLFNVNFSGITIYGCKLIEKKDGETFVSMPQVKGNDGKYYSTVFVSDDIAAMIDDWACNAYESDDGIYTNE